MATFTVEQATIAGLAATFNAANAGGDEFVNDGQTFIYVKNGATDVNVTVNSQVTSDEECPGQAAADKVITVGSSSEKVIGPFNQAGYNDANGKVQLTYDDVSNVTIAVVTLAQ